MRSTLNAALMARIVENSDRRRNAALTSILASTAGPTGVTTAKGACPRPVPLGLFAIPYGLLGLADCWLAGAQSGLAPTWIGDLLVATAILVLILLLAAYGRAALVRPGTLVADLTDGVVGPFAALVVITPMLAAAEALYPHAHGVGVRVTDVLIAATVIVGGGLTGQWIYHSPSIQKLHPGYVLPTAAGGFAAATSAALVGQLPLARTLFGLGLLAWIVLGSIVLGRLLLGPPLPEALTPLISLEVAPPAAAIFAHLTIDGGQIDLTARLISGYCVLMILAQIRLIPVYRRLPFEPSLWALTIAWANAAVAAIAWVGFSHPGAWRLLSYLLLAAITAFIAAIAGPTLIRAWRGELLPAPSNPANRDAGDQS